MKKGILLICTLFVISLIGSDIQAQDWVGSQACATCHGAKYDTWIDSGHPYKFTVIENNQPPIYPPYSINYMEQWMDSLGDGSHDWSHIAGVIGGYGWKSRFVGTDGHIIGTAGSTFPDAGFGHNQINFFGGEDHGWVNYHPNDVKIYNYSCFKCHTTGGDTTGSWLSGVDGLGTFTESGIGCESCHGPGGDHVAAPSSSNIDRVYEFAHKDNSLGGLSIDGVVQTPDPNGNDVNFLCGTCHNRSYTDPINSSGGFIKHHEQWDEMVATDHYDAGFDCSTCHDPHKRVIWDGDGITKTCGQCHADQVALTNHTDGLTCLDCHMPYAAKSGTKRGQSGFKGDVRSHLWKIIPDTNSIFTEDGSAVRDDDIREAALNAGFACLGCHNDDPNDGIPDKTLLEAAQQAAGMHEETFIAEQTQISLGLFPNPTNGATTISFVLMKAQAVEAKIYTATGQLVYYFDQVNQFSGKHEIYWDGTSNTGVEVPSGYYIVQVSAGNMVAVDKLVLLK